MRAGGRARAAHGWDGRRSVTPRPSQAAEHGFWRATAWSTTSTGSTRSVGTGDGSPTRHAAVVDGHCLGRPAGRRPGERARCRTSYRRPMGSGHQRGGAPHFRTSPSCGLMLWWGGGGRHRPFPGQLPDYSCPSNDDPPGSTTCQRGPGVATGRNNDSRSPHSMTFRGYGGPRGITSLLQPGRMVRLGCRGSRL